MITRKMRMSMAVTLGMLLVMLAFGRGRLAPFYDSVGTAPVSPVRVIYTLFYPDHDEAAAGRGEAQDHQRGEAPRAAVNSEAASSEDAAGSAGGSATAAMAQPEPETPAEEPSPTLPDPQAVRDSAKAEVDALGPLHDELIEVLEAIQEAQTDRLEKRWAGDRVAMARFAKRHDLQNLRRPLAGAPEWRVRSTRWGAASARARLDREIAEARETLAKLRGH